MKNKSFSNKVAKGLADFFVSIGTSISLAPNTSQVKSNSFNKQYPIASSYKESMKADRDALRDDWNKVGDDMRRAMGIEMEKR